jgi:hypothetical protein
VQKLLEWMYQKEIAVAQTEVAVSALEEGGYTRYPRVPMYTYGVLYVRTAPSPPQGIWKRGRAL